MRCPLSKAEFSGPVSLAIFVSAIFPNSRLLSLAMSFTTLSALCDSGCGHTQSPALLDCLCGDVYRAALCRFTRFSSLVGAALDAAQAVQHQG